MIGFLEQRTNFKFSCEIRKECKWHLYEAYREKL